MSQFLVFQLYAPMLSWGEAAVGEIRHTNIIPSRSALLGLLAASLGIKRDEQQRLAEFNQHYHFAVRPFIKEAGWLTDYHTIQMPAENKKRRYLTRKDELCVDPNTLGTIVSRREYLTDSYYHIVVTETEDAPVPLARVQSALTQPVFPLYLGRKSCPLALPTAAMLFEGTLSSAFAQAERQILTDLEGVSPLGLFIRRQKHQAKEYYWEQPVAAGFTKQQTQFRNDSPISRKRWQFGFRAQYSGQLSGGE